MTSGGRTPLCRRVLLTAKEESMITASSSGTAGRKAAGMTWISGVLYRSRRRFVLLESWRVLGGAEGASGGQCEEEGVMEGGTRGKLTQSLKPTLSFTLSFTLIIGLTVLVLPA